MHFAATVLRVFALVGLVALAGSTMPTRRASDEPPTTKLTPVGSMWSSDGVAVDVGLKGSYAYLAEAWGGLHVLDISDPARPSMLARSIVGEAWGIAIEGNYAYVEESGGISIVDLTVAASPTVVGAIQSGLNIDVDAVGTKAYVLESTEEFLEHGGYSALSRLLIFDVSDPTSPVELSRIEAPVNSTSLVVVDGLAYLTDRYVPIPYHGYSSRLRIVDVRDPLYPTVLGILDDPGDWHSVAVANGYAYVADNSTGLKIIDVRVPTGPVQVGDPVPLRYCEFVTVDDGFAYVADADGVSIVDVRNPVAPVTTSVVPVRGGARSISVDRGLAYLAVGGAGLQVVDVREPAQSIEVGIYTDPHYGGRFVVADDVAYVPGGAYGLRAIDLSNPSTPAEIGSFVPFEGVVSVDEVRDYLFVHSGHDIHIVEKADPTAMTDVGVLSFRNDPIVLVDGGFAYLAEPSGPLHVFDLSDVATPIEVGRCDCLNALYVEGAAFSNGFVYISFSSYLQIIDVRDPTSPVLVSTYVMRGVRFRSLAVKDGLAYIVGDEDRLLHILDVQDPAAPFEIGTFDDEFMYAGNATKILLKNGFAYVTGIGRIVVIDVHSPVIRRTVAHYWIDSDQEIDHLVVANDRIYTSDYAGFHIFNATPPQPVPYFRTGLPLIPNNGRY